MPRYFSSEAALRKLKSLFSLEYDLVRHAIGIVPQLPEYAVKCQLVRHLYEDWKRCRALRERIQDFGIPHPDKQIDASRTNLVRHLLTAPDTVCFIGGFYRVVKREQIRAYREYAETTLRLNDAPSVEAIEDHLPALERQVAWGKTYLEAGRATVAQERAAEAFEDALRVHIRSLGGLCHEVLPEQSAGAEAPQTYPDYAVPAEMQLEPAFQWRSANRMYDAILGAGLDKEEHPAHHSYTHFTELPIIDLCATIVYDGRHLGFDYVSDFVRQTWDESRHSLMGFSRLEAMGINPYLVPIPVGHYQAYTAQPLLDRIAALTQVGEACSFAPKKQWTEMAIAQGDVLTALEHDFDVVDEKNHVKFGAKWMKALIAKQNEARPFKEIVADAEWNVRQIMNDLQREKGEKWEAEPGERFAGCQASESMLNLAPSIIIS
ncbi:DUF455 family protein [Paenibacillus sacheonensis]|uniref:DUF455 family protein n=1 Tax=Paenibacillus sacheonensis TaxID=742054 RepID=A0A7X5BY55_9BACL|nr:DUF455 family protein [Paenibacillus sacheonensis]MBM7564765.1 hypothetical protein [Paenibacillus sacheonensis]NBC69317.1 DUF455 family protein [Paenibacillus sacheonensis]